MPRSSASSGQTGRPPVTSRAEILAAARRLIDRDGWEKLTIRGLAGELGIGATTLYHHVRDKEDLLLLLLTEYAAQLPHPELPAEPRDRIIAVGVLIHDAFAEWPWAAQVLTTDGFVARIGDPALWFVEAILAGAVDHGCTPAQSVLIFRNIWYYTVGEILVRANTARRHPDADFPPAENSPFTGQKTAALPHLTAVAGQWAELAQANTYPQGLAALVDGLLTQATT
ncbi:TetR family transcriptional regulator [Kribbella italica]|uniref:AcrR family transcriptional regulator n=1 Tax=Kribbella italica TaxID=1540520 RepID=A0A7W9MT93_9ACTN|nr:AcrR family transcriptional regulator [Kribbella italica]